MNEPAPTQLSIEQQFSIRSFETQVQQLSLEQARELLVKMYETMLVRDETYKHLLKHEWGL